MSDAAPSPDSGSADDSGAGGSAALGRRLLLIPIAICVLQAGLLGLVALSAIADPGAGWGSVVVEAIVLLGLAAGLLTIAVGLARARGWARAPLIALELIALLTGLAVGLNTWQGIVAAVTAAACVLVALSRPAAEVLEGGRTPDAS